MARSRNIKPGFFVNEELAEIDFPGRILFIGLWCLADREGRLEDRPKKIKAETFPYDDVDVDKLLNQLFKHNFIIRYEVDSKKYISIPTFKNHQSPHPHEKNSVIPPAKDDIVTCNDIKCNVKLIPDIRNPDIRNPESLSIPYREIVEAYNMICISLKMVKDTTEKRKKAMKARWNKHNTLEFYRDLFKRVQDSNFLTGSNDRNWMADFDWLMGEQNMAKVLEGKYDNRSGGTNGPNNGMLSGNLKGTNQTISNATDYDKGIL
jgi:hypothetical protein